VCGGKKLGRSECGEHKKKENTRYYINLQYYMKTRNESEKDKKERKITSKRIAKISQNTNQERRLFLSSTPCGMDSSVTQIKSNQHDKGKIIQRTLETVCNS
jgi:predicted metal-dependent peptidase